MPLAALLILVPLVEIAVFILVGQRIGVLPTLLLTLCTGAAGVLLLRVQGLSALRRIRAELAAGNAPARQVFDVALIAAAGVLLLLPGFVTDLLGLLLFLPPVRDLVWKLLAARVRVVHRDARAAHLRRRGVVELQPDEFHSQRKAPELEG